MSTEQNTDQLFLEVTYDDATHLLERHISQRHEWTIEEVRQKHDYPRLLYEVSERKKHGLPYDFPEGVVSGLVITLLTENGIIYYPRDVGRIYNPSDKPIDDNDPHEAFTRRWPTEEFPHGEGLRDGLYLTGFDMVSLEESRRKFQLSGQIPRPTSTTSGVAYTGTQELATSKPYRNIRRLLRDAIQDTPDQLVRDVCLFIDDIVGHVAKDERLHASFINGTAKTALESGDTTLVSAMVTGYANELRNFAMPGRGGIPRFRRLQLEAVRHNIFTPKDLAEIKLSQYKKVLEAAAHTTLNADGQIALVLVQEDIEKISTKHPELPLVA